ncbi:MAG TPA: hypothetical protein VGO58_17135 [Chitinophagaceae bacterium]|jgi:flagellar motor protein MotB|nr:hypothetical protein [Chitinophagaceae bacterium]
MAFPKILYSLIACFPLFFYSCVPQKKATSHQQEIAKLDSLLQDHSKTLKNQDAIRRKKQDDNEIDSTTNARMQKFIGVANEEISKAVAQNQILIGQTIVNREDWDQLKKGLAFARSTSKIIGDKVSLIGDLMNRSTVVRLDQDLIFEPGKYTANPEVANSIAKIFEPAAKEIDYFIQKYPDFPLSLVITAKGYADATTILEGSSLYKDLHSRLRLKGGAEPDAKELNKELSRARAEEVIGLLKKFTEGRSVDGGNVKNILYLYEGKGDSFPDPKTTDYKVDDKRRRVVLLFWGLFPE